MMVLRWMRGSPSLSFRNLSSLLDSRKTREGLSWLTLIILFVFCGIFLSSCTSLLRGASLPRTVRLVLSTSLTPICSNWYFLSRLLTYLSRCSSEYCGTGSSSSWDSSSCCSCGSYRSCGYCGCYWEWLCSCCGSYKRVDLMNGVSDNYF